MTTPDQEQAEMAAVMRRGKKRTIAITVDYAGGPLADSRSYRLSYHGAGVKADNGDVDCLGPAGNIDDNKFALRFIPLPGEQLEEVSFRSPNPPHSFYFIAGELDADGCPACNDVDEFGRITMKHDGARVEVVNKKVNSDRLLGYRYRLWITHADVAGTVVEVEFDPRIINK